MFSPLLVHEYLTRAAGLFPDKTALVCGVERFTYQALENTARHLAAGLRALGLKRGDRVVIFLDNSIESVIALFGVLHAGGVFVILDGGMKAGKLNYILRDSGASFLITHEKKSPVVCEATANLPLPCPTIWLGRTLPSLPGISWDTLVPLEAGGSSFGQTGPVTIDQDLATLIYTSGSTGEPKGVMSSHHNMVSAARSIIQYLDNTPDDIVLSVLPLSFDYGLYQVIMAVMFGGTVVLEQSFLYPARVLESIGRERATGFPLVPTIAAFLLRMRNLEQFELGTLRYITNTAAALPVEHIRKLRALLPEVRLFSMYGLTECKRVAYLPPDELDRRPASVGKAIPNTEVYVVNAAGEEAGAGEVGELVIRGSHVMCGYWNAPDLTAAAFRPGRRPGERLLYSGDLFRKDDDGFLYFVGRKDDLIKTRGERVSPREIENMLSEITGVAEAAVFGVPDEILGQAIIACIVWVEGPCPAEREILKFCADKLQVFMVPKRIVFVESLPKSANGKVDKKTLKSEFERSLVSSPVIAGERKHRADSPWENAQ